MRKIITTVSALALVAALGACSKKEEAAPEAATSEAAATTSEAAPDASGSEAAPDASASSDHNTNPDH